jgi:hypothetical protein
MTEGTENTGASAPVDAFVIRLPQRFQWKTRLDGPWLNGMAIPVNGRKLWRIHAGPGHGTFFEDPWEIMGAILGDAPGFRWLDNDYEWEPKGAICCDTKYESAEDFLTHLKQCHQCG